jgi:hypothetical protein
MDCISEKSGLSSTLGTPNQYNSMMHMGDSAQVQADSSSTSRRSRSSGSEKKTVRRSFSCSDAFKLMIKSDDGAQQPDFGFSSFTMASSGIVPASSSGNLSTSYVKNLNETYDKPVSSALSLAVTSSGVGAYSTSLLSPLVYTATFMQTSTQQVRYAVSPNSQIANSSFLDGTNW